MKKAKKILTLVACAVLLVALSVGATLAYLSDKTDTVVNTFAVGNVQFADDSLGGGLDEEEVDEYGKDLEDKGRTKKNEYKLLPGHTYIKDPTIHISTESEACYVRAFVTVTDYADVLEIVKALNPDIAELDPATDVYKQAVAWAISQNAKGFDTDVWECADVVIDTTANTITYEFRVTNIVVPKEGLYVNGEAQTTVSEDMFGTSEYEYGKTDALDIMIFETIEIPAGLTNEQLATLAAVDEVKDDEGNVTTAAQEAMQIQVFAQIIQADGFKDADTAWEAFKDKTAAPSTSTEDATTGA